MPKTNEQEIVKETFNYSLKFDPLEVITKGGSEHNHYVEGYFSTIDEDLAREVLTKSAQQDILRQVKGRVITLDTEHEIFYSQDGSPLSKPTSNIPIGKVVDAELRAKGVWGRVEINGDCPKFKNIWGSILKGFLHSFSVAFYPVEAIKRKVDGVLKSFVNKLNLINITLTGSPVNPEAKFNAVMKSAIDGYKDSFDTYQNIDNTTTNNEVNSMTDEQTEVKVEEKVEETTATIVESEAKPEVKAQESDSDKKKKKKTDEDTDEDTDDEDKEDDKGAKMKSQIASVLKSNAELMTEVTSLKEEVEKLKAKPVIKGLKETMKIDKATKEENFSALDFIQ